MKKNRIAVFFLTACLAVTQLSGCRIKDTEIRLETSNLKSYKNVFQINDYKCNVHTAKLYLCNYRNLYGKVYGMDLWKESETGALETYVKDVTIQELSRIACMDLLAKNEGMSLSEEEQKKAGQAAEEYYQSLNEAERSFMDVRKKDVQKAYEEYALADKLYETLTEDTGEEVSDDEARVIRVQQICVKDKKTAGEIQRKLNSGEDFVRVAEAYRGSGDVERTIARGEYPQEVENIAFNLDNDTCSEMVEADGKYYFIKCLNKFEEELTQKNKEVIRLKREKEQFENSYEAFIREAEFRMNDHLWSKVSLEGTDEITTDSFFATYDKYFD
ncbi:MAG: peptidyl-prolyl cis-trans isomerase [Agathobacter sp.]|nr:peptidyl-prolyl cis-trans isomerase [Agathobacter sp.]